MTHKKFPQREHAMPDRCFAVFLLMSVGKIKERTVLLYKPSRHTAVVEVYRNQYTSPALD